MISSVAQVVRRREPPARRFGGQTVLPQSATEGATDSVRYEISSGQRPELRTAAFVARLLATDMADRHTIFDAELNTIPSQSYIRPDLILRDPERAQINYSDIRERLCGLARAVHLLEPFSQPNSALQVDRACTELLMPRMPPRFDPHTPMSLEGLGERNVRAVIGMAFRRIVREGRYSNIALSLPQMISFGRQLSPRVRVPFYSEIAQVVHTSAPQEQRYSYLLRILTEAQKLGPAQRNELNANVEPLLAHVPPEQRIANPDQYDQIDDRLRLGEPPEQIGNVTKVLELVQTEPIDVSAIAECVAKAKRSHSHLAHQADLHSLRTALVFVSKAPPSIRTSLIDQLFKLAAKSDFRLVLAEHENLLLMQPKIDRQALAGIDAAHDELVYEVRAATLAGRVSYAIPTAHI